MRALVFLAACAHAQPAPPPVIVHEPAPERQPCALPPEPPQPAVVGGVLQGDRVEVTTDGLTQILRYEMAVNSWLLAMAECVK